MTGLIAAARKRIDAEERGDGGFTLLELVVVMVVMAVVMTIVTSGFAQAFSAENRVDTSTRAQAQTLSAFQRLDREVRYAAAVSLQGTSTGGDPVVEFLSSSTGSDICTQVRLHLSTKQLQQRTWTKGATITPSPWQQLVENVDTTLTPTQPFGTSLPDANFGFQRLQIQLTVTYGVNKNATSKASNITFTALNSGGVPTYSTDCTAGRGLSW